MGAAVYVRFHEQYISTRLVATPLEARCSAADFHSAEVAGFAGLAFYLP
jgi:hypothetical protein